MCEYGTVTCVCLICKIGTKMCHCFWLVVACLACRVICRKLSCRSGLCVYSGLMAHHLEFTAHAKPSQLKQQRLKNRHVNMDAIHH